MNTPIIISVAPNGSRKTKNDHPNLPISPLELANEAARCAKEGATLMHLHVRDSDGKHTINTAFYRKAIEEIRKYVDNNLIIQVTTESMGIYSPEQQMQMVMELKPEAVSISIRELIPEDGDHEKTKAFLNWLLERGISVQYVFYSDSELRRFHFLKEKKVIPSGMDFVLFVLGRYEKARGAEPGDLETFIEVCRQYNIHEYINWAVCAFGKKESECIIEAAKLGGHIRVGFENNMHLIDGSIAQNNADLVRQFKESSLELNRNVATIEQARAFIMPSGMAVAA